MYNSPIKSYVWSLTKTTYKHRITKKIQPDLINLYDERDSMSRVKGSSYLCSIVEKSPVAALDSKIPSLDTNWCRTMAAQ